MEKVQNLYWILGEKEDVKPFREYLIDGYIFINGVNDNMFRNEDFLPRNFSTYTKQYDNKVAPLLNSINLGISNRLVKLIHECGLVEEETIHNNNDLYNAIKYQDGVWKFPEVDPVEEEVVRYIDLPYADGIKMFYHTYKGFETYCDKYIPAEFWEKILKYTIRVKGTSSISSTKDLSEENYKDFLENKKSVFMYGGHGKVEYQNLELVETVTERTWYNRFKEALPILEEEYKKLVAAGEIDESDIVIYE